MTDTRTTAGVDRGGAMRAGTASSQLTARRLAIVAAAIYALVVLVVWGAYNVYSGMPGETSFPDKSQTQGLLGGFLYRADPLRIYTSTFYHLSYLLSLLFGQGGSYVPYQIVYAALWWARGFLAFLLVRRFFPQCELVAYVAGAFVITHASDRALQWVGQLNQFGFMFWMMLAFYALTVASDARDRRWVLAAAAACGFEYLSLWSYESQLFLLLVFPVALLARGGGERPRQRLTFACWYAVPVVYAVLTAQKYANAAGRTYQESVMRTSWSLAAIASDWWFNVMASLAFWKWPDAHPDRYQVYLSLLAAGLVVLGGVAMWRMRSGDRSALPVVPTQVIWLVLLGAGAVGLALSFPVYLVLDNARTLWRTQMLSGISAALVLTALLGLVTHFGARPVFQAAAFLVLAALVTGCGSLAALQRGAEFRRLWERHRTAMLHLLRVAPNVDQNTVVVLLNVPKANDPFGDNLWFNTAVRLAYPLLDAYGTYFYEDGTPGPGRALHLQRDRWAAAAGSSELVGDVSLANTVIVDYHGGDEPSLAREVPSSLCGAACAAWLYQPAAVIRKSIALSARRRYRVPAGF